MAWLKLVMTFINFSVYITQHKILTAEVHGPVNVKAVHLDAVALIMRIPDNGALILICI